jgi:hypothetical protein
VDAAILCLGQLGRSAAVHRDLPAERLAKGAGNLWIAEAGEAFGGIEAGNRNPKP